MTSRTVSNPGPDHLTAIPPSPEANPPCGIQSLPEEIMLMVLRELSASNASAVSGVCRQWRSLLDNKPLWIFFLNRDYELSETEHPKELYQRCFRPDHNFAGGIYATSSIQLGRPTQCVCVKGQKLFAGFFDGTIEIWDLLTRTCEKSRSVFLHYDLRSGNRFCKAAASLFVTCLNAGLISRNKHAEKH